MSILKKKISVAIIDVDQWMSHGKNSRYEIFSQNFYNSLMEIKKCSAFDYLLEMYMQIYNLKDRKISTNSWMHQMI